MRLEITLITNFTRTAHQGSFLIIVRINFKRNVVEIEMKSVYH